MPPTFVSIRKMASTSRAANTNATANGSAAIAPKLASLWRHPSSHYKCDAFEGEVGFHRLLENVVLEDELPHLLF